ncbi:MAG: serine/threonine protein kinase [Deltaproteobacteria bacterium]|nr:serine/threonine protein kinase [Deltaproteobacteria bacterium]
MPESTTKLGDYLILERIAHGGMAHVYKAKTVDPNGIERLVVIKRILPHISSDPEYVEMLIDEAKIAVNFTHGNIAQIYDLGKVGNDYFIVMEYVDGKTLGQIVREMREREKPIPLEVIAYCLAELCQALDYIHNKRGNDGKSLGVVHRDISPQNIIVSYSGTVKLIDFGVAKAHVKESHTESGVLKGKFAYMSPEQAEGESVDRRSDIFSAGTLLWELLTQERLFKRKNNMETIKAVRKGKIDPPSKFRKEIPKDLEKIVYKALERKPARRYQHASEMANHLMRFLVSYRPDFKPVHITEFLYRYFGPEADEEDLPAELPQLAVEKEKKEIRAKTSPPDAGEEETEVDRMGNFFSRFRIGALMDRLRPFPWRKLFLAGGIAGGIGLLAGIGALIFNLTAVGTLILKVTPTSASVSIDGTNQPAQGAESTYQLRLESGEPFTLKVVLDGFHPFESTIELGRRETRNLEVNLEKKIPPFGNLFVATNPPGAVIYLDELEWNRKTPAEISQLKHDKAYRVGFFLDGYSFHEETIKIKGGETIRISADLTPDFGSLEILSSPEGANVIMDEQVVGTTPYRMSRIKPGETVGFTVELEGYEGVSDSAVVEAGEKKQLSFELKKKE